MIRTIYFMIINRPSFALTGIDLCIYLFIYMLMFPEDKFQTGIL